MKYLFLNLITALLTTATYASENKVVTPILSLLLGEASTSEVSWGGRRNWITTSPRAGVAWSIRQTVTVQPGVFPQHTDGVVSGDQNSIRVSE